MEKLWDILGTLLGQDGDIDSTDIEDIGTELGQNDDELGCEEQIIQCQMKHDRLLGSTSKALRKKYGNDIVNRAILRLQQRRKRGNCSIKAEYEKWGKALEQVNEIRKQNAKDLLDDEIRNEAL